MLLASKQQVFGLPKVWMKTVVGAAAVTLTLVMTGCASKPQVNNQVRYAKAPDFYTVRSGDTLSAISMRYGLDYISVAKMNNIPEPYRIYVNQSLRLKNNTSPGRGSQVNTQPLQAAESDIKRQTIELPSTVNKAPVNTPPANTNKVEQITKPNTSPVQNPGAASSGIKWNRPTNGPVIASYNLSKNIKGIQYSGAIGDPIYASADGQVVYAADGLKEYGHLVLIKHSGGYITAYAHNNKLLVKSGENVKAGRKIAEMGNSGAQRVMLEFQIRLNGKPIDPANLLPTN